MSGREHIPVIDWLKALGIVLILLGHLAGRYTNNLAPPIYPKQLGVAFFIFAVGYSLSRESRPTFEVLWNRLFEITLWGIAAALMVTVAHLRTGTLVLSNYLPFLLGANVLFNNFPANPTTWYIGTYIHLLLLWSITRRWNVSRKALATILVFEVVSRWLLAQYAGLYIAYMSLTNWLGVYALGRRAGQQRWSFVRANALTALGIALAASAYYVIAWRAIGERSFPLMSVAAHSRSAGLAAMACLVSLLYAGSTLVVCRLFWSVYPPAWVQFIARNTVIIFIVHMPVFYWMDPLVTSFGWDYPARCVAELIVCLVGLATLSEVLHRLLPIVAWRDAARAHMFPSLVQAAKLGV